MLVRYVGINSGFCKTFLPHKSFTLSKKLSLPIWSFPTHRSKGQQVLQPAYISTAGRGSCRLRRGTLEMLSPTVRFVSPKRPAVILDHAGATKPGPYAVSRQPGTASGIGRGEPTTGAGGGDNDRHTKATSNHPTNMADVVAVKDSVHERHVGTQRRRPDLGRRWAERGSSGHTSSCMLRGQLFGTSGRPPSSPRRLGTTPELTASIGVGRPPV
jgi:hypothetical protein